MRIATLSRSPLPSMEANAISVIKTCQALADEGHDVVIFGREGPPLSADLFDFYGVGGGFEIVVMPHLHAGRFRGLKFGWDVVSRMLELGPFDVVMGRDVHSVAFAARRQSAPVVYEAHTPSHPFPRDGLHRLFYGAPAYGGVTTQSDALATWYREKTKLAPESIVWIPEGADPVSGVEPPANWPGRPGRLQAGYVGTLAQGKGTELISAMAARAPDVDFHIVGGPSGGAPLDLGLDPSLRNVHVHGFVEPGRVGAYLSALDCLLVTQQRQVTLGWGRDLGRWLFPMKVYEGMAHSCAMCVSDVPVLHEILTERLTALFVPPDDAAAWVAAIRSLADDAALRTSLAQNSRTLLESEYTWRHRARRIVSFAETLLT